jgi:phosphopantetheine--protein transferase-like protein
MNRNNLMKQNIIWHQILGGSPAIATFTDSGTLADEDLRDCLSAQEGEHASQLRDPVERRHYIARRCFQRLFICELLSTNIAPNKLAMVHQRDTKPHCLEAPGLNLSFSSSGATALACASSQSPIGVDIERLRKVENVVALAQRYFTAQEATALAQLPIVQQNLAFLHYWTAKEAGLKAIGKGIVYGLNTFSLTAKAAFSYEIHGPTENSQDLVLEFLEIIPQHVVALVKLNYVGKN